MEHREALEIARDVVDRLELYCSRIEIAGSLRRRKEEVGDIEIVCVPKFMMGVDMFGVPAEQGNLLEEVDWNQWGRVRKSGRKYKQIELKEGIKLDLFIVTAPAQWGVIYVIRTGPADFSKWLVTKRKYGGALPSYAMVRDGAVWDGRKNIPMQEETDFFDFCGLGWIKPERRDKVIISEIRKGLEYDRYSK